MKEKITKKKKQTNQLKTKKQNEQRNNIPRKTNP